MPVEMKTPCENDCDGFNEKIENLLKNQKIVKQCAMNKNMQISKENNMVHGSKQNKIHSFKYYCNGYNNNENYECEPDMIKDVSFEETVEKKSEFDVSYSDKKKKIYDNIRVHYRRSWETLKDINQTDMKDLKEKNQVSKQKSFIVGNEDKFCQENYEDEYFDESSERISLQSSIEEDEFNKMLQKLSSTEGAYIESSNVEDDTNKLLQKLNKKNLERFNTNSSDTSVNLNIDRNDPELKTFAAKIGIDIGDNEKPNKIFRLDHLKSPYIEDPLIPNGNIFGGHYGFASEFQLKEKYSTDTFDFLLNVVKDYALFLKEHPGSLDYPSVSELMVHSDQKLSEEDSQRARYYDKKYLRSCPITGVSPLKTILECNELEKKIQTNSKLLDAFKHNKCIKIKQKEEVYFGYYASSDELTPNNVFPKKHENIRHGPLSQDEVNEARETGILNLSHRSLVDVPERIWSIDVITEEDRKSFEKKFEIPIHSSLWWTFKSLISLNLNYNSLTTFCPQGSSLISLRELRVTNNMLEELPDEIGNLRNLIFLDLDTNSLKNLPGTLCNLKKLEQLKLKQNFIEALPDNIGNLIGLIKLDLSFNKLVKLPVSMSDLVRLECVNLSFNKLSALPLYFNQLKNLEVLDVSYNKINNFPSMQNMSNLIVVNATCNAIHLFPDFSGCKMLTELRLDGNNIKNLVAVNLKHCPLIQLTMSNNKVEAIPDDMYHVSTLVLIDVSNNRLMCLPWSLARLKYLTVLNVDSNNISNIDRSILEGGSNKIIEALREKLIRFEGAFLTDIECGKTNQNNSAVLSKKFTINAVGELHQKDKAEIKNSRHLNCSDMELSEIPSVLLEEAKESEVCKVDLSKNIFNFVPVGLRTLTPHLTELILKENYLKTIPNFIGRMKLVHLDVSFNYLDSLPLSMGSSKIQKLVANNNCFSAIPKVLYSIQSLEHVDFEGNRITEIDGDKLKNLINLSYLNFNGNSIDKLPASLTCLPKLNNLQVSNNSFKKPSSDVLRKGTEAILEYLSKSITEF